MQLWNPSSTFTRRNSISVAIIHLLSSTRLLSVSTNRPVYQIECFQQISNYILTNAERTVRFEALTGVTINITVFCDVRPCNVVPIYWRHTRPLILLSKTRRQYFPPKVWYNFYYITVSHSKRWKTSEQALIFYGHGLQTTQFKWHRSAFQSYTQTYNRISFPLCTTPRSDFLVLVTVIIKIKHRYVTCLPQA
jgi:hypothetical protein